MTGKKKTQVGLRRPKYQENNLLNNLGPKKETKDEGIKKGSLKRKKTRVSINSVNKKIDEKKTSE